MSKLIQRSKGLYWALIGTFIALYIAVAFVSTLHAVTFFQLANTLGLAILLGAAYEIGQAAVLFSILMTENKNRLLAWGMMFLLTALQVTANVYASFKFMDASGSQDWTYWQRAILFGVEADSPETYKVIISWISGALLPLVALGMTALVADNIKLAKGEVGEKEDILDKERLEEIVENEIQKRLLEVEGEDDVEVDEAFELIKDDAPSIEDLADAEEDAYDTELLDIQDQMEKPRHLGEVMQDLADRTKEETEKEERVIPPVPKEDREKLNLGMDVYPKPVNKMRGWHLMKEYVDDDHNVFSRGAYVKNDPEKIPTSKKA